MISAALVVGGILIHRWLLILAITLFALGFHFFRNPDRSPATSLNSHVLLAPADGRVVEIASIDHPEYTQKIAIFLSPLDVHVTRIPTDGVIEKIIYKPGQFSLAWVPKSSELNERNEITVYHPEYAMRYEIRQIAGTLARVIRTFTREGAILNRGDRCGMIKFGSRVEILLPDTVEITVAVGEYLYGGVTPLALWKTPPQQFAA
jgi:phosphatidylserine decarboxylase